MPIYHPPLHEYYLLIPHDANDPRLDPEKACDATFFSTKEAAKRYLFECGARIPAMRVHRIYVVVADAFDEAEEVAWDRATHDQQPTEFTYVRSADREKEKP